MRKNTGRRTLARLLGLLALTVGCDEEIDDDQEGAPPGGEQPAQVKEVGLVSVASGFTSPVALVFANDGTDRMFIVDRVGRISVRSSAGPLGNEPFLDISDRIVPLRSDFDERGLLGLALSPTFSQDRKFYVYYSAPLRPGAPPGYDHTSRVSEFVVSTNDMNRADRTAERVVLEIDKPQFNHNGGALLFGTDGYLYISIGDGGEANDVGTGHPPRGNGQDKSTLLGSILRIDVRTEPYSIPTDNPFVGQADARNEIFAHGFRNPWRMSFDLADRRLFVADAGQNLWEEVSIVERGQNYGWNLREGAHCFDPANPDTSLADCPREGADGEPLVDPIIEYQNINSGSGIGLVVVGGFVYRGNAFPSLRGQYVFGDWSRSFDTPQGTLLAARPVAGRALWEVRELDVATQAELGRFVLAFGQDPQGEIYVLTSTSSGPVGTSGTVFRMAPPTSITPIQ